MATIFILAGVSQLLDTESRQGQQGAMKNYRIPVAISFPVEESVGGIVYLYTFWTADMERSTVGE